MRKSQFLLAMLLAWTPAVFAQELPSVFIQSITRLLPRPDAGELSAGDLLVLDLDNTVFREAQLLGTDDWYSHAEHELRERGLTHDEAEARLHSLNFRVKSATRMRLMEEQMPAWIRELQEKRVQVIGLTARHPEFADLTIRQLRALGIQFQPAVFTPRNMSDLHVPGSSRPRPLFKDGVTFVRGEKKGYVLRAMLEAARFRPGKVIAVDDRIHHTYSFVDALTEMKIPGVVIHYLKAQEEPPFDPRVADMQRRYFEATGILMPDEYAKRECELLLDVHAL
jgi:hypothetical protein